MRAMRIGLGMGLLGAVFAAVAPAQEWRPQDQGATTPPPPPAGAPRQGDGPGAAPGNRGFFSRFDPAQAGKAAVEAVLGVMTNAAVVEALGLTPAQVETAKEKLTPELIRDALAADAAARTLVAILTDARVAGELGLSEAQVAAARIKITASLIAKSCKTEQIEEAGRALATEQRSRGFSSMSRQFTQRFDKDGDGQLSREEREAAGREMMDRFRGGGPDGGPRRDGPLPEAFKRFDTDGDGRLSQEERDAARRAREREAGARGPAGGAPGAAGAEGRVF